MLQRLDELAEKGYYGMISIAILLGSVMGGIMAMFTLEKDSLFLMAVGLAFTMANLVLSIAQSPPKWIVRAFLLSIIVNTIIILISMTIK
ncbi:MAG: hypothetical protein D6799_06355 [Bacteroidetes bacterium]|jgi:hypothetical protein|nr:MAG: hypothetical protein D6799_06355 [Bacteroidota bacterium]